MNKLQDLNKLGQSICYDEQLSKLAGSTLDEIYEALVLGDISRTAELLVNTVPPATLEAFRDHGTVALTLESRLEQAQQQLEHLSRLGVDLEAVTEKLQVDGAAVFAESFRSLRRAITVKAKTLEDGGKRYA